MESEVKVDDANDRSTTVNANAKKDDTPVPTTSMQMPTTNVDTKPTPELKNSTVRIVRATKRTRADNGDVQSGDKKEPKEDDGSDAKIMRSLKRSCELWSLEDKNTFFKAVNEFGKDFDALQSYFLIQGKKRGLPEHMIKNKEQIRHFYYRSWLKISKHLKFSEDVKKTSQELYGLINYGELRRKLPRILDKAQMKLNELVYFGSTRIRYRGKTLRIKTPICRALRKLNQLEDWQEDIKLPSRVTIELRPGNNSAWWQVQAASMNPRVRLLVPIQRRVSSILSFLQQRWQPMKYKPCLDSEKTISDTANSNRLLLRFAPPEGCKITLPVVNLGECLTSSSVSLNSHEKRLGLKSSWVELLGSMQYLKGVGRKGIKKNKTDKRLMNRALESCTIPDNNSDIDIPESCTNVSEKLTVNTEETPTVQQTTEPNRFPGRETIERIRLGWNMEEVNTITVGDLFLMFGRDSKVVLEYWWDIPQSNDNSLCLALRKLLSIAKHSYGTNKGYDNVSGSNETVVSSRVPSIKESTFKRPLIPQGYHKTSATDAFETQMAKFKTRFCKRGRTVRPRSLIVQRVLPIVSESISYPEVASAPTTVAVATNEISLRNNAEEEQVKHVDEEGKSSFLCGVLQGNETAKPSNSIITSATQILKEEEHQWLNSEVADFSLSSFLGQLESPIKGSQQSQTGSSTLQVIRPPSDVISNMQCLMGENSLDYMVKFANLASQIASEDQKDK